MFTSTTLVAEPEVAAMQASLFGIESPSVDESATGEHIELSAGAWVEVVPRWLHGADLVFEQLMATLSWRQRKVVMYHRLLDEPRLTSWWRETNGDDPLPVLAGMREALVRRFGRPFDSIGYNLYRNGRDSVAWHGDTLRNPFDSIVAIVSVGSPRPLQIRPAPGVDGHSHSFPLGEGTLFVMGGTCQATWQHSVPKLARPVGPRMSITFRHESEGRYPSAARARAIGWFS
jgi:alkylated DNA repair dioxygenase AlkB